ncbi:MAG: DUF1501 domain-containing protein [Planctomycetaceae bacterium]|nr:DUF1501 domain-containing protein [Planctomycetaceae bacterium]
MNRRELLSWSMQGLGATSLLHLLQGDNARAAGTDAGFRVPAKARRAVQISLVGGMSHIDSFDYKPKLAELHGKSLKTDTPPDIFFNQVGLLRQADWEFRQRGQSGLWVSELFPHIAEMADELTVIRSMVADSANHTPALFVENSGFQFNGYPSLGGWLSYGLGAETENLPAFVVLPDGRSEPNGGSSNWTSGFLPAQHQGVAFRGGSEPVKNLRPALPVSEEEDQATRAFLAGLNYRHLAESGGEASLTARIRSYELAARMQLAVPEVADLSRESAETQSAYGLDRPETEDCGRRCLLARRLLEQGVRFVQIYSGGAIGGSPRASWDAHESVQENHRIEAGRLDQPVAALLRDLKQRGMLEDTLVLFTTEFGRTPFALSADGVPNRATLGQFRRAETGLLVPPSAG